MPGSPIYHYLPSFGQGRRNDYAGAIGGYIVALHRNDVSLDEPIRLSPTKLAKNFETDPETIRTALERLCSETARFKTLLEKMGRSEYRLTPEGVRLVRDGKTLSFSVIDLVFGDTPKESAIKNTDAVYPGTAAKWLEVSVRQWYRIRKRTQVSPKKWKRSLSKSGYMCHTETEHRGHPDLDRIRVEVF